MTTLSIIFKLFSVNPHRVKCDNAREKLEAASARLAIAKKGSDEAREDIKDALEMNEASECERQAAQQDFVKKEESGLFKGVDDDDQPSE